MTRLLQNTTGAIEARFYAGSTITDPGVVTLQVLRADGTEVVVAGTGTGGTGAAARTYTLTTTHTALLDDLTALWTSPAYGVISTQIEIVGGFVFTTAQGNVAAPTATDTAIQVARTEAEVELERALGYALVPRYAYETISAHNGILRLRPLVRAIRSVSIDGVALSALQLAELAVQGNHLYGYTWPRESLYTPTAVTVGYEHGMEYPPPGASTAALNLAMGYLGTSSSAVASGAERLITDDGTLVFGSGSGGSATLFGDPVINRWVAMNQLPVIG